MSVVLKNLSRRNGAAQQPEMEARRSCTRVRRDEHGRTVGTLCSCGVALTHAPEVQDLTGTIGSRCTPFRSPRRQNWRWRTVSPTRNGRVPINSIPARTRNGMCEGGRGAQALRVWRGREPQKGVHSVSACLDSKVLRRPRTDAIAGDISCVPVSHQSNTSEHQ